MIKAKSVEFGVCIVFALLCTGCSSDSVRDLVFGPDKSQQAKNDDTSVASSETGADGSDTGSQYAIDPDEPTSGAATEFDPYDPSPLPDNDSSSFDPADTQPAIAPSDSSDGSDGNPPFWQTNGTVVPVGGDQTTASRPRTSSGRTTQVEIRLRTAVALPQSLPTGTAMFFSVDYQVTGDTSGSQVRYVWVIKPPNGQVWESAVQLQSRGTLQSFVTEWGPVTGNYEMWIDEVTRYGRKSVSRAVSAVYR